MTFPIVGGLVALILSASAVVAQQPGTPNAERRAGMAGSRMTMVMMDSLNRRLDSLVDRMNHTKGQQKLQEMAAVINELVVQRKALHWRMRQMMGDSGRMGTTGESTSTEPKPTPGADTAADTTDHTGHHPPK